MIINLPGSVKGCLECFEAISPALEHATKLLRNADVKADHGELVSNIVSKVFIFFLLMFRTLCIGCCLFL